MSPDPSAGSSLPMVSVIIPSYNHAHYLGQALQSALDQDYPNYEILVVDDGSKDNSREVTASFDGPIRYIYQENQGLSAARNTGIEASRGSLIALLDADDQWLPAYLSKMVAAIEADKNAGAVYSGWRYVNSEGDTLPQSSVRTVPPGEFIDALAFMNFLVPSGVLFRRACYDELGEFDRSLRAVEDRDMWLRIAGKYEVVGVPEVLVRYRTHGANMTKDLQRMEDARRAVVSKHFGPESGDPQEWPQLRCRAYGGLYFRTALDHLEIGDAKAGETYLQRAFIIYPQLIGNLQTFYELGCAEQPRGYRGIADPQNKQHEHLLMFELLNSIFDHPDAPKRLAGKKAEAFAMAHYAAGLLAYQDRDSRKARTHLFQALRLQPALVKESRLRKTFVKSLLGDRMLKQLTKTTKGTDG